MNERDEARLEDMLVAARKARTFASGKTREMLDKDDLLAFAIVRAIEIIGEAASRVSNESRDSTPQIPWNSMIGMRNKIIHDYINVDNEIVWNTVIHDLPKLIAELEQLIGPKE